MKLDEIKKIAKQHEIKIGRLNKTELVQAIQLAEGNEACFASEKTATCGQDSCLWRSDC